MAVHADLALSQRQKYDADLAADLAEAQAGVSAALSAIGRGEGQVSVQLAATSAMEKYREEEEVGGEGSVNLDEFGRDLNLQKRSTLMKAPLKKNQLSPKP